MNDYFGLTPNHFIYAGPVGWDHFHLLLTALAENVENTDITEINTVYACILFIGHGKDKYSDRSYRTISTCPVIAKALDSFIRDMNIQVWNLQQSECQFLISDRVYPAFSLSTTSTDVHSFLRHKVCI